MEPTRAKKLETLKLIGYTIGEDPLIKGLWIWSESDDMSGMSFDCEEDAVDSAWGDACCEAMLLNGLSPEQWMSQTFDQKVERLLACHALQKQEPLRLAA